MRWVRNLLPVIAIITFPVSASAAIITFETFSDPTLSVSDPFPLATIDIATFINAEVLASDVVGGLLPSESFPPASGTKVGANLDSVVTINFSETISSFSGFFTATNVLTLSAFDAANTEVASTSSSFAACNFIDFGCDGSPNEVLTVAFAAGIHSVQIAIADGGQFVFDDLSFEPADAAAPVPEPATGFLLLTALVGLHQVRRRARM